jgi:sodium/potassium-transporting ATPase subunit alpha
MNNDEHKIGLDDLLKRLDTDENGLSGAEAVKRQEQYGYNILEIKKKVPLIFKFAKHFFNFFAILLWIGAILAFMSERLSPGIGNYYIGVALVGVVVLNAVFTFILEYESERIMENFRKMMPATVEVFRDGIRKDINTGELVPGDVVYLEEGVRVPADGRLIEANSLKVDNSSLTGESEPQLRKLECTHDKILESRNMVFSGTTVQTGNGKAVVYSTGMNTQIGRIAGLTKEVEEARSPLGREINHFIKIISVIAILLGVVFFAVGFLHGEALIASLIFAIGIIVANVPEGLLPTVTLSLSMASNRMARKMALIKRLESVETLGSTTVICTDKTGTITENRISANTLFLNYEEKNVNEKGLEELSGIDEVVKICVLCNNARRGGTAEYRGDPTEIALLRYTSKLADIELIIRKNVRIHESPFDSNKRRMITHNSRDGRKAAYLKGAPEVVISKCNRSLHGREITELMPADKERILEAYERMASRGERVLALAYKVGSLSEENNFIFTALIGLMDPPRKEIPEAISRCKTAGIKVIMITGDNSHTAEAIARLSGMIERIANIMTGDEMDASDDKRLEEFLNKADLIFARTTPSQKLRIVKVLRAMGHITTVTGDGVNDAPALKHADMGVAMGLSGTDVAKEAAEMVLLDDNFATIVSAIEEGRTVFSNIKKFIGYILTSNVPEILPFIAFVLLGIPLPLTVVLILSIDLGTDILPALGLGVERSEFDVMRRPPRPSSERLLSLKLLLKSYGIYGMIEAGGGFFSYFVVLYSGGWRWGDRLSHIDPLYLKAITAFFVSIVLCQIANVMICRTKRESILRMGFFSNRLIVLGIFVEIILVWLIVYNPAVQKIFGTYELTVSEMLLSLPFAFLILFADEIRKVMLRNRVAFAEKYLDW